MFNQIASIILDLGPSLVPTQEVSIGVALGAGIASFFSPCILPMIPIYIMYITGSTTEEALSRRKLFVLSRTLGFILGFTLVFLVMGLSASLLGQLFLQYRDGLYTLSGVIMVIFGLQMMGVFKISFIKLPRVIKPPKEVTSFLGAFIMGLAFGAGWSPCFGPILAAILINASQTTSLWGAGAMLLVYALGMAIPFIITALFIQQYNKFLSRIEKYAAWMPKVAGLILIVFGLLIISGKITLLNTLFL